MQRKKNGQFAKGGSRRRRRRRTTNREENPAPRRRRARRRRSNPSGRRRRRRRNPGLLGGGLSMGYNWKDLIPYMVATAAQAWMVRRFGDSWGTGMLSPNALPGSPFRGQAWTLKNYLIALATGWVGAKLISRTGMGAHAGSIWWRASIEQMATRLVWTEMIARWGWAQNSFGQLPAGAPPGTVADDGQGNRWLMGAGGQWVSMQGYRGMGELVNAGHLGSATDGGFVPLEGYRGMGELVKEGHLGHLLPSIATSREDDQARHLFIGSKDPYAAVLDAA
jgi:hypothetical protein